MHDLLQQIESATNANLYYVALLTGLCIPDICGAMESNDGEASRQKYVSWFNRWVAPKYLIGKSPSLTGEVCYYYRCSALHQGRATHPKMDYSRVLFVEPGVTTNVFHNNILGDVLNIDLNLFVHDLLDSARIWLLQIESSADYKRNHALYMQRYPNGLAPYIVGVPVIA